MTVGEDPLSEIALLRDLTPDDRARVAGVCGWQRYRKGQTILDRADTDRDLLFCVEGELEITSFSSTGRAVSFARLNPGAHFGELSAIDGRPRSATAVAESDVLVARLPEPEVRCLLQETPEIAWRLLARLAGTIRTLNDRVIDLNTRTVQQRVIRELLESARPSPVAADQWIVQPAPTQATLAARADSTRETVARVLGDLRDSGLVTKKGRCLTLHAPDQLRSLVDDLA
jgi:CRP-like cAMP-binding protein